MLFEHLLVIGQAFGRRLRPTIGMLGSGPRADAVFDIARLNRDLGVGVDIDAAMAFRGRRDDTRRVEGGTRGGATTPAPPAVRP